MQHSTATEREPTSGYAGQQGVLLEELGTFIARFNGNVREHFPLGVSNE
jgi:hypothetical protein